MTPFQPLRKKFFYLATASLALALVGCGGGNDDDPEPTGETGVLRISNSTDPNINGFYGSTNIGLTGVKDTSTAGPNECAFNFDNVTKVSGDRTLGIIGDIRYAYPTNNNATPALRGDHIKIGVTTFNFVKDGTNLERATVNLTLGTITFNNLLTRDSSGKTAELSGVLQLPDAASRDSACRIVR